ncbi:MAG TPA: efflux RND transporter permease subunit [Nannocystaceae bacterium]|nr:efflux RND transporter permease subunit [Nannocystaceae bacterium]
MNLVRLAVQRPITVLMALASVLLLGWIALQRLPLAFLPEVDVPFIAVEISQPESSPAQIEKNIAEPVEEALATLPGIKRLRSTSTADDATIVLELQWGQSLDVVRMQVAEKLELVKPKLPAAARQQIAVFSFNTGDIPVVEARISAPGIDLSASYPVLESRVLDPLRRIPGVARVELDGVLPRVVYVDLVRERVREHNVDVGALLDRLQAASAELVLGQVTDGEQRWVARGLGNFESLDELAAMPIGIGDLRLRDVAEVRYEEPPIPYGRHLDREYAVGLRVFKESTANTVEVVELVLAAIEHDIGGDPELEGIELFVWENQAEHIRAGIDGLKTSGMVGAALAVLCLYVFLRRLDSTAIVALSIPFSVVATCGVLYFMGKSLNLLSMMGLMLGVGMLVDNAIVVLESIDRCRDRMTDSKQAALEGASSVTMAVVASTATTLIVFLPLVLGSSTELTVWLREVGITISLALACSLLSSLTLIPLVAARMRSSGTRRRVGPGWLESRYASVLAWTLRHRKTTAALLVLALAAGAIPFATKAVRTEVFSATVNERLFLQYRFDDFHYKYQAEKVVDEVEAFLDAHADEFMVEELYSWYAENEAATVIVLARRDLDDAAVKELRASIRDRLPRIPGVDIAFDQESDAGDDGMRFSIQLFGRDGEVLERLGPEVRELLVAEPGVKDVRSSADQLRDEIEVTVDRDLATRQGLTAKDAADTFGFTLGGLRLPRFREGGREVDSWLALRIEDRAGLRDLKKIAFPTRDGSTVRLADIARFETVRSERQIERENRQGKLALEANYEGEDWEAARERIGAKMDALAMPLGYGWSWDARTLEKDDQNQEMAVNFALALVLVYLVLASLFESLSQPLAILSSIVFAVPGAAWMLAATDTPLNLMAQIGLLILMGVVVNNGVVLLDRVNQLRIAGIADDEAFVVAGRERLRPILMTALTTVLGLVPMAMGGSAVGGLFYFPLARCVIGGLLSSSLLTLLALPLVTHGVEAAARGLRRLWHASAA